MEDLMKKQAVLASVMTMGMAAILAAPVEARSFRVNSTADLPDTRPGDGICDASGRRSRPTCTLRAAVMEANATRGEDRILLESGRYSLNRPGAHENAGSTGDLDISDHVAILGSPGGTVVDGAGLDRVFHVVDDGLKIGFRRIAITGGAVPVTGTGAGGIQVDGRGCILDLYSTEIQGNLAANGRQEEICMGSGTLKVFDAQVQSDYNAPNCGKVGTSIAEDTDEFESRNVVADIRLASGQ